MNAATSEKEIENAVAAMLGVEEPEPVVAASQSMIEVQDDTDLEAAAKFNMNLWLNMA